MKAILDTKEFKRVIRALKPFTNTRSPKTEYIEIEFNSDTQEAKAVALDGHRVALEYIKCKTDSSFTVYIKPFTFMKTEKEEITEIELIDGVTTVNIGLYTIKIKQPKEEWFNFKEIMGTIKDECITSRIGINADLLIDALKNVKKNESGRSQVILECRGVRDPVVVREVKDRRNMRFVLPMSFKDEDGETCKLETKSLDKIEKAREELEEESQLAYEIFSEIFKKESKTESEKKAMHLASMIMQTHAYLLDR